MIARRIDASGAPSSNVTPSPRRATPRRAQSAARSSRGAPEPKRATSSETTGARARRRVADVDAALDGPVRLGVATRGGPRAQHVVERLSAVRPLADRDVGEQEHERAAPVHAADVALAVEAAVAGLREALRQAFYEIGPHALGRREAGARARDRLDVGR